MPSSESTVRRRARYVLGGTFLLAGVLHFLFPSVYARIIPPWVPRHRSMVFWSGIAEVAGGVGVLHPNKRLRRWAGWGLAALLVAVFPANVHMAREGITANHAWGRFFLWLRLPLQLPLIAWSLWASGAWKRGEKSEQTVGPA